MRATIRAKLARNNVLRPHDCCSRCNRLRHRGKCKPPDRVVAKRHLRPEQREEIKAIRQSGTKLESIASQFGVTKSRIAQIVGPCGNYVKHDDPRPVAYPDVGIKYHQTEAERKQRETAAKYEAWRLAKELAEAKPTGDKCRQKACPFPAVLEGECRRHAIDRHADSSAMPSTLALAQDVAHILGYYS